MGGEAKKVVYLVDYDSVNRVFSVLCSTAALLI